MALTKINSTNMAYITACLVGILVFVLVGIYPNSAGMKELDIQIEELNEQVKKQELLYPAYIQLLKEIQQKRSAILPLPDKKKIRGSDFNRIRQIFADVALRSQVELESAAPDASSYLEDTGHLKMDVVFRGDFFNIRQLVINICGLPYLENIDQMRIESMDKLKRINFKLVLAQE